MIPGLNILELALSAITPQTGQWLKFTGNTQNSQGQDIPSYAEPVEVYGSFQPVDVRTVHEMGFDTSKKYRMFYTSNPIAITERATSPDVLIFYGRKYNVAGDADWYQQDGQKAVMLVDVGPA